MKMKCLKCNEIFEIDKTDNEKESDDYETFFEHVDNCKLFSYYENNPKGSV